MKKLNLNSKIKVKLTPRGMDVYYHQFDELNDYVKRRGGKPFAPEMPKVDEDGFTEMQLWSFIEIYGAYIGMGKENVIEPLNFYIEESDLEDVET